MIEEEETNPLEIKDDSKIHQKSELPNIGQGANGQRRKNNDAKYPYMNKQF